MALAHGRGARGERHQWLAGTTFFLLAVGVFAGTSSSNSRVSVGVPAVAMSKTEFKGGTPDTAREEGNIGDVEDSKGETTVERPDEGANESSEEFVGLSHGAKDIFQTANADGGTRKSEAWPVEVVPEVRSRGSFINKVSRATTDKLRDAIFQRQIMKGRYIFAAERKWAIHKRVKLGDSGQLVCESAPWRADAGVTALRHAVSIVAGKATVVNYVTLSYELRSRAHDRLPTEVPLIANVEFQGRRGPLEEGSRGAFVCREKEESPLFLPLPFSTIPQFSEGPWSVSVKATVLPNPLKKFSSEVWLQVVDNVTVVKNIDNQIFALPDALRTPNDLAMFSIAEDECREGNYCTMSRDRESWGKGSKVKLSCRAWDKKSVTKRVIGAALGLAKGLLITAGITYVASQLYARGLRKTQNNRTADDDSEINRNLSAHLRFAASQTKATLYASLFFGTVGVVTGAVAASIKTAKKNRRVRRAIESASGVQSPWLIHDPTKGTTSVSSSDNGFDHYILSPDKDLKSF